LACIDDGLCSNVQEGGGICCRVEEVRELGKSVVHSYLFVDALPMAIDGASTVQRARDRCSGNIFASEACRNREPSRSGTC
jgi:hypothetical protein